jgi:hypothetical protein
MPAMIRHVVMWTFKDSADGRGRGENVVEAARRLSAMAGRIPGLLDLEVGPNVVAGKEAWDLALAARFPSAAELEVYQRHPVHLEVVDFIRKVRDQRAVVDLEITDDEIDPLAAL